MIYSNEFVFYLLIRSNSSSRSILSFNFSCILTDKNGRTSVKGIYAAGDVTDVSYKQIVIAMGEGAKAALAAFEDRMRGTIY